MKLVDKRKKFCSAPTDHSRAYASTIARYIAPSFLSIFWLFAKSLLCIAAVYSQHDFSHLLQVLAHSTELHTFFRRLYCNAECFVTLELQSSVFFTLISQNGVRRECPICRRVFLDISSLWRTTKVVTDIVYWYFILLSALAVDICVSKEGHYIVCTSSPKLPFTKPCITWYR